MTQDELEKQSNLSNPYKTDDDQLAQKHLGDTRKPKLTLRHLNKLRKMKELRKFDLMKQEEFIQNMYGQSSEQPIM